MSTSYRIVLPCFSWPPAKANRRLGVQRKHCIQPAPASLSATSPPSRHPSPDYPQASAAPALAGFRRVSGAVRTAIPPRRFIYGRRASTGSGGSACVPSKATSKRHPLPPTPSLPSIHAYMWVSRSSSLHSLSELHHHWAFPTAVHHHRPPQKTAGEGLTTAQEHKQKQRTREIPEPAKITRGNKRPMNYMCTNVYI